MVSPKQLLQSALTRTLGQERARSIKDAVERFRYPYLSVKTLPTARPSRESIYYWINQLGKHRPVGLTHQEAVAYHELPFPELKFKVSRRDLAARTRRIVTALDVRGKYGVDFGCAIGGLSFALQKSGALMLGMDRDEPSLQVARECEAFFRTGAKFRHGAITVPFLQSVLRDHFNPKTGRWDFAIWLSSFNWVAQELGREESARLLGWLSENCDQLLIDSAIGGKGQEAMESVGIHDNSSFEKFVLHSTKYDSVTRIGQDKHWYGREVFVFSRKNR